MADFTPTQGRYLAFIYAYTRAHKYPPSEAEIGQAMLVSPPSVNQMVKTLEKRGLISRRPGQPRSLQILIPEGEIPSWNSRKSTATPVPVKRSPRKPAKASPEANLYVVSVYLMSGPVPKKFAKKVISRAIEIRGDQTLELLHDAIFEAYDREDEHMYQFQFGKRPYDPKGPNFGLMVDEGDGDARTTAIDDLKLKVGRVFGYWFDFGDDWFHQIQVEKIERAIPTVVYPRITKRSGQSPPQYSDEV